MHNFKIDQIYKRKYQYLRLQIDLV
jgi:hypothetical protein